MRPIWRKEDTKVDDLVWQFTVGDDPVLDNDLVPYDVVGSLAHVGGLKSIGMLSETEAEDLSNGLREIYRDWEAGNFRLEEEDEDVHSALERVLVDNLGDTGKKVHAGRSRNDQILTAMRLFMKAAVLDIMALLSGVVEAACISGKNYAHDLMPGYTHGQRAMPSSIAQWYASHADNWTDTLCAGAALYGRLDASPLGAAAGFGVPLPLDRELTAKLMGFGRVQINATACQNSRGRLEANVLSWLVEIGRDVEKMAWDLMMFTTAEYGFVRLPSEFCTGSSIMPQKRNPDVLELLRAVPSVVIACRDEVERIMAGLPSNYHRDLQLTKPAIFRGLEQTRHMLEMLSHILPQLEWDTSVTREACTTEVFSTHRAFDLVKSGVPFRDAYRQAANEYAEGLTGDWDTDPDTVLAGLSHLGAPGNPGWDQITPRLSEMEDWAQSASSDLFGAWRKLLGGDE